MSSIDVVVPCYRYGRFLRECVESVLTQPGVEARVLIIDDASPDNTAEIGEQLAREDPRVTFWRHGANKGNIATYNEGIEWASADYFLLLSADDYLLPGALGRAVALMDAHPDVAFTFGGVVEIGNGGTRKEVMDVVNLMKGAHHRILSGQEFVEAAGVRNIVATATAVVRTALQKRVGGYRADLPHAGDMEMWFRLAAEGSVGVVGAFQAIYRRHDANMSLGFTANRWLGDLRQRKAVLDCFAETPGEAFPNKLELLRRMQWALGGEAVGWASAAFNDGDVPLCDELSKLAVDICPEIKRSWAWAKLVCKRGMGRKAWSAIQMTINGWRQPHPVNKDDRG